MNDPRPPSLRSVAPTPLPIDARDVIVPIEVALEEIRAGRMVVLVDDEDRENEGDLCMAAEKVTPEAINFMARFGRGLICLPLAEEQLEKLRLGMMVPDAENSSGFGTAFTVSIEAREGVTTGISAHDRAHTILTAIRDDARPQDIVRPGHVFPLRARTGGVLRRAGQTEGSVDLARLAGLKPAGVICEIMNDDGSMARMPDLVRFARQHELKIVTIADLIEYRLRHEKLVRRAGEAAAAHARGRRVPLDRLRERHRPHRPHRAGEGRDPARTTRCSCACTASASPATPSARCAATAASSSQAAMRMIEGEGKGVLLYMRQEGRGIGLKNKIRAYGLQDRKASTRSRPTSGSASRRTCATTASARRSCTTSASARCASSRTTPASAPASRATALTIVERVPLEIQPNEKNLEYLRTKKEKLGHVLHLMS